MYVNNLGFGFGSVNLYNPFYLFSGLLVISGVLVAIVTDSNVSAWLGIEINVIGFLGVLSVRGFINISVGLKYFIIQVLGSGLFLVGVLTLYSGYFSVNKVMLQLSSVLVETGLFCKAGLFPFHMWIPSVISLGDWFSSWLILGVQKLAPMVLISVWSSSFVFYVSLVGLAFVGSLGGLNQLSVRGILAYSSFVHSGWIMAGLVCSIQVFFLYFLGYLVQLSIVMGVCYSLDSYNSASSSLCGLGALMSLSLSGLPPMGGFLFKLMVFLISSNLSVVVFPVLGSIISLLFYLRLMSGFLVGYLDSGINIGVSVGFLFSVFNGVCYFIFGCLFGLFN